MNLTEIQDLVYTEYIKNGYKEKWTSKPYLGINSPQQKISDLAELGLIITEVSEAMEEIREKELNMYNLAIECSDIIIRVLNFMSRNNLEVEPFILIKHNKNMEREKLHGKGV